MIYVVQDDVGWVELKIVIWQSNKQAALIPLYFMKHVN